jgi:hypothetical protein
MAFHYSPKIVTDGLILYLDAANTRSFVSGSSVWNNLSRDNSNNGTLKNTATYSSINSGTLTFDGFDFASGAYVDLGTTTTFDIPGDVSVSVWHKLIKPSTTQAPYDTLYANGSMMDGRGAVVYYAGTGPGVSGILPNKYTWWQNGSDGSIKSTSLTYSVGEWRNITVTRSGSTGNWKISFYINGNLDSSHITTSNPGTNQPTSIGRFGSYNGNHFNGNISNVKLYKRELSASEVLKNFNALKSRYDLD